MRMLQVDAIVAGWIEIWRSENGAVSALRAGIAEPSRSEPADSAAGLAFHEDWRRKPGGPSDEAAPPATMKL